MIVSGQIVDKNGAPLVGATVAAVTAQNAPINRSTGGVIGTSTNQHGYFDLFDAPEGQYLRISYVGYKTVIIPVKADVFITMEETSNELPEATVTGKQNGHGWGYWALLLLGIGYGIKKLKGGSNG